MRPLVTIIVTITLAWCALHAFGQGSKPQARTVPPIVYLGFPESVQVDKVYIYPSTIAFRSRRDLKPNSKFTAKLSNLHERPNYSRVIACTYNADDDTYWIEMPEDVPPEVSVNLTIKQ